MGFYHISNIPTYVKRYQRRCSGGDILIDFRALYEHQDINSYYRGDHITQQWPFFKDIPPNDTILNVGCGKGASLKKWPNSVGLDFNRNLIDVWEKQGLARQTICMDFIYLNTSHKKFDWTVSCDFLEHVDPENVDIVLRKLLQTAVKGKHIIDLIKQSGYRGPKKENLHCSANDNVWWDDKLKEIWGKAYTGCYLKNNLMFVGYDNELAE